MEQAGEDGYTVTVTGGTGTGNYTVGTTVTVSATIPEGKTFKNWTASGITLEDNAQETISFEMPANAVVLTANFAGDPEPSKPGTGGKEKREPYQEPDMADSSAIREKLEHVASGESVSVNVEKDYKVGTSVFKPMLENKDTLLTLRGDWYGVTAQAMGGLKFMQGLNAGKIPARLLAGRLVDLPLDSISAAVDTDNAADFAKQLATDQATGLVFDSALEGISAGIKAIRPKLPLARPKAPTVFPMANQFQTSVQAVKPLQPND